VPRAVDIAWYAGTSTDVLSYGSTPKVSEPLGHATLVVPPAALPLALLVAAALPVLVLVLALVVLLELLELHAARPRPITTTPTAAVMRYGFFIVSS
jgi:hypothetical protein